MEDNIQKLANKIYANRLCFTSGLFLPHMIFDQLLIRSISVPLIKCVKF